MDARTMIREVLQTGGYRKILVCGGRDYQDFNRVYRDLCRLQEETGFYVLVHGAARGADSLAARWAGGRVVEVRAYPADWTTHRRGAGPIRNRQMFTQETPDLVLAYPGGPGTADMRRVAAAGGVLVVLGGT